MANNETPGHDDAEPNVLDGWVSRDDLARELGVSVATIARWECRRIGPPCVRIGRAVHYRRESVRAWLVAQERHRAPGGRK